MKLNKNLLFIIIASVVGVAVIVAAIFLIFGGEEEPMEKPLELIYSTLDETNKFALIGDDDEIMLTNKDVEGVSIMYPKGGNRYLEIRFTEEGKEKFEDAIDDYDELTITLDGKVLTSGVVANEYEPEKAKIIGEYKVLIGYFNEMT